jgi:hypothetical protein
MLRSIGEAVLATSSSDRQIKSVEMLVTPPATLALCAASKAPLFGIQSNFSVVQHHVQAR